MRNSKRGESSAWATKLKRARERKGWNQDELAERAGVSRFTIIRWEQGEQTGKPENLTAVADALGIRAEDAFRAMGWLPPEGEESDPREELMRLIGEMTDNERELFLIEILEWEARRRRNSQ